MRSTFHGLEIAKRGLFSHQTALSTTGHNIANAATEGYSRQRVNLTAARPIEVPALNRTVTPGQLGTGASFDSITRLREKFLDDQFRNEAQSLGSWNVQKDTLEKIEILFNEQTENGLSKVIDEFWNSWHVLSSKPDDLTARHVLKQNAIAMLDHFKYLDAKLTELATDIQTNIDIKTEEANTYITQIAQLNEEIRRIEGLGHHANDLRDKRDLLTDKLAGLAHINVTEQVDGTYTITLAGAGTELVNGAVATLIGDQGVDVAQITGGELHGMNVSLGIVSEYQAHLNAMLKGLIYGQVTVTIPEGSILAADLVDEEGNVILPQGEPAPSDITITVNGINGLHSLGWTLRTTTDGNGNVVPQGNIPFFVPPNEANFSIQNVTLNPEIVDDVGLIAASLRLDTDGTVLMGNGALALLMAQLRHHKFNFDPSQGAKGVGTFEDYLRSVVGSLGVQTKYATDHVEKQKVSINAIENRRQSVSGVSLDEEMTNLIRFQHAYNASARAMTTMDQVLDRIINQMGIVGR